MNFVSKIVNKVLVPGVVNSPTSSVPVQLMSPEEVHASLSMVQRQSPTDPRVIDVCVSIKHSLKDTISRGPADICCVIDVSGSMTTSASVAGAEDAGLSILDTVKHSVNTITHSLSNEDRLTVITFSNDAKVVFANLKMDAAGKAKAISTVNDLRTEGRTNLWAGLLRGMDVLHTANLDSDNSESGQRNTALFLLTDGVPNVNPPEGHVSAMQRFKDQHGGHYPGAIHTFGFGYSLDSTLLNEIAMEGNGTYNFIPDSGFVGTAFVNTLANQLASFGTQGTLSLQLLDDDSTLIPSSLFPNGSHCPTSWGVSFNVGNLLLDQQRHFMVQIKLPEGTSLKGTEASTSPLIEATLHYKPLFIALPENGINITQSDVDSSDIGLLNLETQMFRSTLVRDLTEGYRIQDMVTEKEAILLAEMQRWHKQTSSPSTRVADHNVHSTRQLLNYVSGLMDDLSGQIRMAHTKPANQKWGTHYIPSLRCAHQRQLCNNFKDPGVQLYGGHLFQQIRDSAEEVFLSLPPPKPSSTSRRGYGGGSPSAPLVNMSAFHNASAGCFAGCGLVSMADGTTKLVRDVLPGDQVLCDQTTPYSAVVECVVRTKCTATQSAEFVELSNQLLLTPWHPVWHDEKWQFPMDITGSSKDLKADFVYNFVLGRSVKSETQNRNDEEQQRGQSLVVNGLKCITLAHGIDNDPVATHEFYGTARVLCALQQYEGYEKGIVEMDENQVQRNETTGLVCGFASQNEPV